MFHDSLFNPASPQALDISNLFVITLLIMGAVVLLVTGLVLYAAIRFRARPGEREPRQQFGIPKLEIAWTGIPIVLLLVLFGLTVSTMNDVQPSAAQGGSIEVIGHQWWWEIRYAGTNVVTANELHLPVGTRVLVAATSADVIHDLWLPQLGGKMDLVPGQINHLYLEADRPGTYLGVCAEYCGVEHAWMLIRAVAQPKARFEAWLRAQEQPAATTTGASTAIADGARYFGQLSCAACHAIFGTPYAARVGPDLTHVGSRQILASGTLPNNAANMAAWLRNPQSIKPGTQMPDLQLNGKQVTDLTAYLESLK